MAEAEVELKHTWKIPDGANEFIKSNYGAVIHSEVFELGKCKFYIEITPNGFTPIIPRNFTCIWLAIKETPDNIGSIDVEIKINIPEIKYFDNKKQSKLGFGDGCIYSSGFDKIIPLKTFENVDARQITIELDIFITKFNEKEAKNELQDMFKLFNYIYALNELKNIEIKDIDYDVQLKWDIDNVKKTIFEAKQDSIIESKIWKYKDCEFYLELTPNGFSENKFEQGTILFWLLLKALPKNIKHLNVEVVMKIDEIEWKDTRRVDKFGLRNGFSCINDILKQERLKELDSFTFICDIKIHEMVEMTEDDKAAELFGKLLLAEMFGNEIIKQKEKENKDIPKAIENENNEDNRIEIEVDHDDESENGFLLQLLGAIDKDINNIKDDKNEENDEIKDENNDENENENDDENEDKRELKKFILDNGLSIDIYNKLIDNDFESIDALLEDCFEFTNDDWKELGIKLGSRKKLLRALVKRKEHNEGPKRGE